MPARGAGNKSGKGTASRGGKKAPPAARSKYADIKFYDGTPIAPAGKMVLAVLWVPDDESQSIMIVASKRLDDDNIERVKGALANA